MPRRPSARARDLPRTIVCFVLVFAGAANAGAQTPAPAQPGDDDGRPGFAETVDVVETAPLPGIDLPPERVPAPVQSATAAELDASRALDVADFLNRRLNGVHVNETQGNPFQPDVNYRGYTASPLLGTPQGLSVYMDGVRLNQPFGDVVSWDLIPRIAIGSMTLMTSSSPLFGLNTLGGALSVRTKDGFTAQGTTVQATYGSDLRRAIEFEHGGRRTAGLHWYVAGNLFAEDGWRDDSPSSVHQLFGKVGWLRQAHDVALEVAYADNSLTGNGLQEQSFLARDFASVYTKPDQTDNRSAFLDLTTTHRLSERTTISANAYYRNIRTGTLNGDIIEESLDQSIYQPGAEERAALAAAGYEGFPSSGANASNTPFPFWRCVGNVLLNDEPSEKCNGLINRSRTVQHNAGASGQLTRRSARGRLANLFAAGGALDLSGVGFRQSTELGYLTSDRGVTGLGAYGDGVTGGEADGEPFDTRVDLDGQIRTWSLFASNTLSLDERWHLTLAGRYNQTSIRNRDRIVAGGGDGSLDGDHDYRRFNPAAGLTFTPATEVNLYAGYSEGSRTPTSIELGCADPDHPCKLPNAMAGDPPLDQVVTGTWEGGIRGRRLGMNWNAGLFRAANRHDILFVTSGQTGFGYFRNVGETRRQGVELGVNGAVGRLTLGGGYTYLRATFESREVVNGESNSSNDAAADGMPGMEGTIAIVPGDRMPLIPAHTLKLYGDVQVTAALAVDVNLIAASSSYARGNENNRHEADGTYYLAPGQAPAYAIVNVAGSYALTSWARILAQVTNLFDRRYYTGAQLGPAGFTGTGAFMARPFPAVDGEYAVRQSTFFAPGAPARFSIGTSVTF
jgi:outer membrane receptor protein involved in Fe transport